LSRRKSFLQLRVCTPDDNDFRKQSVIMKQLKGWPTYILVGNAVSTAPVAINT